MFTASKVIANGYGLLFLQPYMLIPLRHVLMGAGRVSYRFLLSCHDILTNKMNLLFCF